MKTFKFIFVFLIVFTTLSIQSKAQEKNIEKGEKVFVMADEEPEFKGGKKGLIEYISNTVKYPENAKKKGIQGKVYVSFVIAKDGSVKKPKIKRSVHPSLDKESLRVVKMMPDWKPGKLDGNPVNVEYTIPIKFALQ